MTVALVPRIPDLDNEQSARTTLLSIEDRTVSYCSLNSCSVSFAAAVGPTLQHVLETYPGQTGRGIA